MQGFRFLLVLCLGLFTVNVATAAVVTGNQNANIIVVEYFDYQCPHCRIMARNIHQAMENNQNVKLVSRVVPVMDGSSWFIARAALAARKQDGYAKFNGMLMEEDSYISKDQVMKLAKISGLNLKLLQRDMHSPEVTRELNSNLKASQAEGVTAVPVVVITHKSSAKPPLRITGDKSVAYLQGIFRDS